MVVAPDARVRHLEAVAGGLRQVALPPGEAEPPDPAGAPAPARAPGRAQVLRPVPPAPGPAPGAAARRWGGGGGAGRRATGPGPGRWRRRGAGTSRRLGELRRLRAEVRAHRVFPDKRGAAPPAAGQRPALHLPVPPGPPGLRRGPRPGPVDGGGRLGRGAGGRRAGAHRQRRSGLLRGRSTSTSSTTWATGPGATATGGGRGPRPCLTRRSRLMAWLLVALVLLVGTRDLIGGSLPLVGQFLPFPTWTGAWHQLVAGWQPAGLGTTAPATPGLRRARGARHRPARRHGPAAEGAGARVHPRRRLGGVAPAAALGLAPGPAGRRRLLPGPAAALRRAGPGPLGRAGRLRRRPVDPLPAGPVERAPPARRRARPHRLAVHAPRADGRPRGARGGRRRLRAGRRRGGAGLRGRRGARLGPGGGVAGLAAGVLAVAGGATAVAARALRPLGDRHRRSPVAPPSGCSGLAGSPGSAPGWSDLLRFAVGPVGRRGAELAAGGRRPPAAPHRPAGPSGLGRPAVGGGLLLVGAGPGGRPGAGPAPFSPSVDVLLVPAATAVVGGGGARGRRPSRPTWPATASAGASW